MSNTNVVVVSGNLGSDVETASTQGGTLVVKFNIAMNKHRPDGQGGFITDTSWITVKSFGNLAERLGGKLSKGFKVIVTGEISEERWQDKATGENRSKLLIIAASVENLSLSNDKAHHPQRHQAQQSMQQNQTGARHKHVAAPGNDRPAGY